MNDNNKSRDELLQELIELRKENEALKIKLLSSPDDCKESRIEDLGVFDKSKLLEDKKTLKAILDTIPDGIVISSLDGVVRYASENTLDMIGYDSADGVIGKNILDFIRNDYHNIALSSISEILKGNYTGGAEIVILKEDGSELAIESKAEVIRNSLGKPVAILYINRDITHRKKIEQNLNQIYELFISGQTVVFKWKNLPNWPVEYVSRNVFTQFGYKPEDFTEGIIHFASIIHSDDLERVSQEVAHYSNLGVHSFEQEYRIINSSGETRWIYNNTVIQRDEFSGIEYYHGTIIDITDKQISQIALKKSQVVHSKMIANISDVIVVFDSEYAITYKSPNIEYSFGWKSDELIGKSAWDVVHLDDREYVAKILDEIFKSPNASKKFEIRYQCKDGSFKWIEITLVNLLHDEDIKGILGNYHDISDRKDAEKRHYESEEKYRLMAENTSDAFLIFENNVLVYSTRMYEEITGYSYEEIQNLDVNTIAKRIHPDDVGVIYEKALNAVKEKKPNLRYQYRIRHKNGNYVWIEDSTSFIYNENGENTRAYIVSRDITERIHSENELRKLSQAIEQSPVSVVITDLDGNIEYVNAKTHETTGYSQAELLGQNPRIWQSGKLSQEFYEKYWETITSGKTWTGEFHNKKKNGELYWEHATIAPLLDTNGEITNFIGVKEDISKRKLMEEDLKLSKAKLQSILDNLQDSYIQADLTSNLVFANPAAATTFGYSSVAELLGISSKMLYANIDERNKLIDILSKTGSVKDFVVIAKRKDNSRFWVSLNVQFLKNEIGQIIGYEAVIRDISSRIKLENELIASKDRAEKSEHKVRSMFQNSLVGFLYITIDGFVKEANPSALELLGSPSLEATKQINALEYQPLIESGFSGKLRKCISNRTVTMDECLYTSHWGKTSFVKYYLIPMLKNEVVIGVWANINDLTDLWQVQQDLTISKEKAEESDRLKSAFLRNISHEIRTPINGIMGFSKMLSEFELNDGEKHEYAEILTLSCNRLMNTVNDIINISEIDTSAVHINKSMFMPSDIMYDLYETYQYRMLSNDIELIAKIEPDSEYLNINSDSRSIYQIIYSFLSNAEKFTIKGKVEFGFSIKEELITFFVKDTGIGIAESEKEKIFERFYQVDLSVSRGYDGTGLGLSIAIGLSNLLGGKIWVESQIGVGSTFYFSTTIK